ncbi:MAG: hypothetical protein AB1547_05980 [Thermodesulfobacteriota bacterium]
MLSASDIAVWSQREGTTRRIVCSRKGSDGVWSSPVVLSRDDGQHVTPSIARGSDGKVWVVWTNLTSDGTRLTLVHSEAEGWSSPENLPTGMRSNTAPCIWADEEGMLWIVWAGSDGGNDDIFVMRGDGRCWSSAERIHPANNVPDVLPAIESGSNGMPLVKWSRFANGRYRTYSSVWQGVSWSTAVEAGVESVSVSSARSIDLPQTVDDPEKAVVLEQGKTQGLSLRARYIMFQKRLDELNRK